MLRIMRRVLLVFLGLLIGIPALYVGVAFALTLLTPRLELPRGQGITIYACDNGVHTDLVLPISAEGIDWRQLPHPSQSARSGLSHVSIGWGSRDFYINTPTWADVRPMAAAKALLWDETVLHLEYRSEPTSGETCGVWVVGSEDYRRIITFVRASGVGWSPGTATLVAKGYGPRGAFYTATGEYTPIETCNQWTGRALRLARAPVAPWTPFSFLVTWNLPMISK